MKYISMPENRKYFVNKSVHLITARTEEGLSFVPSFLMNFVIWGILARARTKYDVRVCHFKFLANHLHMIIVVDNPEHVPSFVGYIKGETAHAVNRLLGRRRKTVWAEGYDSPAILTPEDVLRYINYIYLNAASANLVDTIDEYPGVSSWKMFKQGIFQLEMPYVPRPQLRPLQLPALSINEQERLVEYYQKQQLPKASFVLEPYAWMECFPRYFGISQEAIRTRIIEEVRIKEGLLSVKRLKQKKRPIGATTLRRQSMLLEYTPSKFSRKMICLCSNKELRKDYIEHFKSLAFEARKTFQRWKQGLFIFKIPPGLFAPCMPVHAVAIPLLV